MLTLGAGVVLGYILFVAALFAAADRGLYNVKQGPGVDPLPLDDWADPIMFVCVAGTTIVLVWLYVRASRRVGLSDSASPFEP